MPAKPNKRPAACQAARQANGVLRGKRKFAGLPAIFADRF
jgi:hypothetical protein